jgi:uracil-DNA glycosylase
MKPTSLLRPGAVSPGVLTALAPAFDAGPPPTWARLFGQAPLAYYTGHPAGRFRTEFGPVYYRGRLKNASSRLLIVGQDPSTDELLAQRNLVGSAGQRVQRLLRKLGLTRSYTMFNTFLFGIKGQLDPPMRAIAQEAPIRDYRNRLFDKLAATNPLQAIVSFGNGADLAIEHWPGRPPGLPWLQLHHPSADEALVLPNWNAALAPLHAALTPDAAALVDLTPYGTTFGADGSADIPRADLPFGLPVWHGTGGSTRSQRDGDAIIKWQSPL